MYIYSNFSNTGLFKLPNFLNYFLGPFNLLKKTLLNYPIFSNFNFLSSPIFRTFFKVPSLDYPQFF